MTTTKPKILLFDIETAPLSGYLWSLWKQNVSYEKQLISDWYMLSFAAKWLDRKTIKVKGLINYPKQYKEDPENDYMLVKELWALLDEADIVVAHNGNGFDIRKIQERFIAHGMEPPSPFKAVDTLLSARRHFAFTSNKMGNIATRLGISNKITNEGFKLWEGCIHGNRKSRKTMLAYNKQDIVVLDELYKKIRPWIPNHPSLSVYDPKTKRCPICFGVKLDELANPYRTNALSYTAYRCTECGAFSRARINVNAKSSIKHPLRVIQRR